jgi:hypothetical protein
VNRKFDCIYHLVFLVHSAADDLKTTSLLASKSHNLMNFVDLSNVLKGSTWAYYDKARCSWPHYSVMTREADWIRLQLKIKV